MNTPLTTAAILVAGGRGERMGGTPKQYRPLAGVPVLRRAVDALRAHPRIGRVVVVVTEDERARAAAMLEGVQDLEIVAGGVARRDSVAAGLAALPEDSGAVLIHDAARPLLPSAVIDRLLDALEGADGVCPVLPVIDTLARRHEGLLTGTVDRGPVVRVQTPQAFHVPVLRDAHARWSGGEPTDDAQMVRALGGIVKAVEGDERLAKLTWDADFARAEALLGQRISVTGHGYDVHRLVPDEELWLCGIRIEHDLGLSGHSDADVGLHALTDALLGAVAAGDIGDHFPPTNETWRGARSDQFLAHAAALARDAGARLEHLDVTLICEAPKIGPHKRAMRERIADIVDLPVQRVSVKATTTEALGFTGRREGIAAQATATVSRVETEATA